MRNRIVIGLAVLAAFGFGVYLISQPIPGRKQVMMTNAEPIARRLPKLGQLQSVCWWSSKITLDSFLSPPERPAYRLQGFAQLARESADEISRKFEWQNTPSNWKPAVTDSNLVSTQWSRNDIFTEEYKPKQLPGRLFFNRQKGIVYFDLEIE